MKNLIKSIRAQANLNQEQFASALGTTAVSINRWENGKSIPNKMAQRNLYQFCKDQGIDVEFTGMDYFAVRSTVDPEKQEILRDFVLQVYADPEFQQFMADMGMAAWEADGTEILSMVESQTEAMTKYIPLVQ